MLIDLFFKTLHHYYYAPKDHYKFFEYVVICFRIMGFRTTNVIGSFILIETKVTTVLKLQSEPVQPQTRNQHESRTNRFFSTTHSRSTISNLPEVP